MRNHEPSVASTAVQLIRDKKKRARSSSVTITLACIHPSTLTSLEENRAFFDQGRPLLEPDTHYHEVFSTTTPDKTSNFGQSLEGLAKI